MASTFPPMNDIPDMKHSFSPFLSPSQSTNGDISEESSSVGSSDASTYDLQKMSSYDDSSNENEMLNIQARDSVISRQGHIVQFYYDEEYLYNSIIRYGFSLSFTYTILAKQELSILTFVRSIVL
jgi:hypothetical protein